MRKVVKRSNLFLIFGYIVGMLSFTFSMSYIDGIKYKELEENVSEKDQVSLNIISGTLEEFNPKMDELGQRYNYLVSTKIEENKKDLEVVGTFFIRGWMNRPSVDGRLLSKVEIDNGKAAAVIGHDLKSMCYEKDGEKYIKIDNLELKVVGQINQSGKSNNKIYIPFNLFKSKYGDKSTVDMKFIFLQRNIDKEALVNDIKDSIGMGDLVYIKSDTFRFKDSLIFYLSIIVILICGINVVNFSYFWIEDKKKEISLRKTVGATNLDIGFMLFKEMFILTTTSMVISYGIFSVTSFVINRIKIFNMTFILTIDNFKYSILLCSCLALITTIPPYIKSLKLQPAIVLKGE